MTEKQEITYKDLSVVYDTTILFGSDALFQGKPGIEAKWRNEILKILLQNPGGENLWNRRIRKYFNLYLAGYEDNYPGLIRGGKKERNKKRVTMAFEKILTEKGVPDKERAKDALSKQRANLQLPEFKVIQSLKDKLV